MHHYTEISALLLHPPLKYKVDQGATTLLDLLLSGYCRPHTHPSAEVEAHLIHSKKVFISPRQTEGDQDFTQQNNLAGGILI